MSDRELLGTEVECRWAFDWRWEQPQPGGRIVAVTNEPQVLIEKPDGSKMWWAKSLTRPQPQEPPQEGK